MAEQPQLTRRDAVNRAALNAFSGVPVVGVIPSMVALGKAEMGRENALAAAAVKPAMVIPNIGGAGAGVNPPAYIQPLGNTGHRLGGAPLTAPVQVVQNPDGTRSIAAPAPQLNPALAEAVATQQAQEAQQQYSAPAVAATEPYQPTPITGTYMGGNSYVPLHSTTNTMPRTPTFGRDALDIPDANRAVARQYADIVAAGGTPILNEWDAMHLNRLRAQGSLALSAATKAADTNDMYRAMNDPDTRNRAQQIASTQGVSFDTAMKMALAGTLAQQGDYALANRYESTTLLPAMEAEQQQRIALGIGSGTDTPAMADYMGNTFNSSTAPTSVYGTGDGNVRVNTPSHSIVSSPENAAGQAMLLGSTAPLKDGYALSANQAQMEINSNAAAQQAAAKSAEQAARLNTAQRQGYEKMAVQQARLDEARYKAAVRATQQRTGASPTHPRAANEVEYAKMLIQSANLMPKDDPNRKKVAAALLNRYGIKLDDTE